MKTEGDWYKSIVPENMRKRSKTKNRKLNMVVWKLEDNAHSLCCVNYCYSFMIGEG